MLTGKLLPVDDVVLALAILEMALVVGVAMGLEDGLKALLGETGSAREPTDVVHAATELLALLDLVGVHRLGLEVASGTGERMRVGRVGWVEGT